jgi:hypothetical protein
MKPKGPGDKGIGNIGVALDGYTGHLDGKGRAYKD